ncbi:pentapeptide repeat-containing protein [Croceitalea rosinachiae]|uniref:Pentapeptide repeat-containing protein n=1 Tax=Croceitalea rosinachiae TaxID=3075596 RepID=A0ABU3A8M9_9FLAO|nr:pentapeptide repeat-containing protein [Croceitalea sp. F388]MDT0605912.1 pentapeptide repeat-containing protein [Croceitalea sp. F388]
MSKPFVADKHFKNEDFTQNPLARAVYEECVFEGCQFQNGFLDNQNFVDCTFRECDLSNTNVAYTLWNNVFFESCKLVGVAFDKSDPALMTIQFDKCNLTLAVFYGLTLHKTDFSGSNLSQADFTHTDLTEANFTDCNLDNTVFENTNLSKVNLSKAFNFNINPEVNTLKKARFSKEELIGLLKKHDIVIE